MSKYVGYAISICIISMVLRFSNRQNETATENRDCYVLKIPDVFIKTYFSLFLFGILIFFFFLCIYLSGNPTVTTGHLVFALVITTAGTAVTAWGKKWKLTVNNDQIELCRLFHQRKSFSFSDIADVKEKENKMILYDTHGKKLISLDAALENYRCFKDFLKKYGKLEEAECVKSDVS